MSYEQSGVGYDALDAFKRACQRAAATTTGALAAHGVSEPGDIRGESAYLVEAADEFLAHVEEGLGTKNLVADAMLALTGTSYYRNIGIDLVATIANDLCAVGALPLSVAMFVALSDPNYLADPRGADLAAGFAEGCRLAGAAWGGGETQGLKGMVDATTAVLAGSSVGRIRPKSNRIAGDVKSGDAIVLLASSGVQTNGLTLCRALAERLPDGYLTRLADGRTYGESLLDPSVIYVRFVDACQRHGLRLNYAAHLTGHGWRKLMRLDEPFVYEITTPRNPPALFEFLIEAGPIDRREAYATFNMGVGFAAYVSPSAAEQTLAAAAATGYDAWLAGHVRKDGSRKAVVVPTLRLEFEGDTLQLR